MSLSCDARIAIVHPHLGIGGSEVVALHLLQALVDRFHVTVIAGGMEPLSELNKLASTNLKGDAFDLWLPRSASTIGSLSAGLRGALIRRAAHAKRSEFDLMISGYNPMPLGPGAVHFMQDFSFDLSLRNELHEIHEGLTRLWYSPGAVRSLYEGALGLVGPNFEWPEGDTYVANSEWTAKLLQDRFSVPSEVIYPPVPKPGPSREVERDETGFVWLGRWAPEKRLEDAIWILSQVRHRGYPVTLHLLGGGSGGYARRIRRLIRDQAWIRAHGFATGAEKSRILRSNTYGLSTCRNEAFGIGIAEQIQAGLVTFAPASGGQAEVVELPELMFDEREEAVRKICRVLPDQQEQRRLRRHLQQGAERFTLASFTAKVTQLIASRL